MMFIWEWVLIALGWLIFLLLVAFIFLFMRNLNKELKKRK
nr:MAG TPA: Membrane fusion protein Use1 [Caudoviricetes sp.]